MREGGKKRDGRKRESAVVSDLLGKKKRKKEKKKVASSPIGGKGGKSETGTRSLTKRKKNFCPFCVERGRKRRRWGLKRNGGGGPRQPSCRKRGEGEKKKKTPSGKRGKKGGSEKNCPRSRHRKKKKKEEGKLHSQSKGEGGTNWKREKDDFDKRGEKKKGERHIIFAPANQKGEKRVGEKRRSMFHWKKKKKKLFCSPDITEGKRGEGD